MDQLSDHSKSSHSATFAHLANRAGLAADNYRTFIFMLDVVMV